MKMKERSIFFCTIICILLVSLVLFCCRNYVKEQFMIFIEYCDVILAYATDYQNLNDKKQRNQKYYENIKMLKTRDKLTVSRKILSGIAPFVKCTGSMRHWSYMEKFGRIKKQNLLMTMIMSNYLTKNLFETGTILTYDIGFCFFLQNPNR